jgi:hypothetical protein
MGSWRHDLIPILSLTGVILDALGGLYLAYDLLGGKHGPLRTITKSVSYGIMFGSIYGLARGPLVDPETKKTRAVPGRTGDRSRDAGEAGISRLPLIAPDAFRVGIEYHVKFLVGAAQNRKAMNCWPGAAKPQRTGITSYAPQAHYCCVISKYRNNDGQPSLRIIYRAVSP